MHEVLPMTREVTAGRLPHGYDALVIYSRATRASTHLVSSGAFLRHLRLERLIQYQDSCGAVALVSG